MGRRAREPSITHPPTAPSQSHPRTEPVGDDGRVQVAREHGCGEPRRHVDVNVLPRRGQHRSQRGTDAVQQRRLHPQAIQPAWRVSDRKGHRESRQWGPHGTWRSFTASGPMRTQMLRTRRANAEMAVAVLALSASHALTSNCASSRCVASGPNAAALSTIWAPHDTRAHVNGRTQGHGQGR